MVLRRGVDVTRIAEKHVLRGVGVQIPLGWLATGGGLDGVIPEPSPPGVAVGLRPVPLGLVKVVTEYTLYWIVVDLVDTEYYTTRLRDRSLYNRLPSLSIDSTVSHFSPLAHVTGQ